MRRADEITRQGDRPGERTTGARDGAGARRLAPGDGQPEARASEVQRGERYTARRRSKTVNTTGASRRAAPTKEALKASEHQEQVALFDWASRSLQKYPELVKLYAVPNAGGYTGGYAHNKKRVIEMLREGLKPGVFDVNLDVARGEFHGLRLELKSLTGRLSDNQKLWMQYLVEEGYCARECCGWEEARRYIEWYLSLPKPKPIWLEE